MSTTSLARITIGLILSFVLVGGLMLMQWSLNSPNPNAYLVSFGAMFTMLIFTLMCVEAIRRNISINEEIDYAKNQIDLMIDSLEFSQDERFVKQAQIGVTPTEEISEYDDIEFNYVKNPEKLPSVDESRI